MKSTSILKKAVLLLLLGLMTLAFPASAFADGWAKVGKKTVYSTTDESGNKVFLKGVQTIGNRTYMFNRKGYMFTGWVRLGDKYYYLRPTGKFGVKGCMYKGGVYKIKKKIFLFGADGNVLTGPNKVGRYWYFFSTSTVAGVRGRLLKSTFAKTADGKTYYARKNGRLAFGSWVKVRKKYYYLDDNGVLLRNTTTTDGYVVNKYGVRTGKASSGSGKSGTGDDPSASAEKLKAAGTKAATGKASILILCGHGQGDSGAIGMWGGRWIQEQTYTRDFGRRVYNALLASGKVNVDLFDPSYDTFQQFKKTLNSVYVNKKTLQSRITGSGKYAVKTYKALSRNPKISDPLKYDYVLEIHFDASGVKDYGGNGVMKGTFMYVNKRKPDTTLDARIISALNGLGLPVFVSSVWRSPGAGESVGLLNARTYQEMGVSYGLLETCFIDDKDDMKFYFSKRDSMAKAVSDTIVKYFS